MNYFCGAETRKTNLAWKRLKRNFANFKCELSESGALPQSILFLIFDSHDNGLSRKGFK